MTLARRAFAEFLGTAALLCAVIGSGIMAERHGASLVACYIGAAYWFTASTSFANPAAVLGRMLSDSFAGIAPSSAPGFVIAQCVGGAVGVLLARSLGAPPRHGHSG